MIYETHVQGKWARPRFSECSVSCLTVTVSLFTVVADPVINTVLVNSLTLVWENDVNSVVEMYACVDLTVVLVMVAFVALSWLLGVVIVVILVMTDVVEDCCGWLHTTIMEPGTLSRPFIWSESRTQIFKLNTKMFLGL